MRVLLKGRSLYCALTFWIGLLSGGALLAQSPPADDMIADAVGAELRHSDLIGHGRLELAVEDAIVSITGAVPSITMSRRIEDVVSTVRGVRSIVNRLQIESPPMSAESLNERIAEALEKNAATDAYQISASADADGNVILDGSVDSWAEFELAELVVGSVPGVRSVENTIAVEAAEYYRGGGEIQTDITERYRWDARVDGSLISVLVRDGGRVTLSGTVGSLAEKRLATSLAYVSGVRRVDSTYLDVEPWARDENRRLGADTEVADAEIQAAIEAALALDPRVASSGITVEVSGGDVWLRGEVSSIAASDAAGRTARNTYGVGVVRNRIMVEPSTLSDAELLRRITGAIATLDRSPGDDQGFELSVLDGRVRIAGDVADAEQFRRLDETIRNTRGVQTLVNDLTVRGELPRVTANPFMTSPTVLMPRQASGESLPTDRELHSSVESELFWSPFVDEDDIEIAVDEGNVTLTGTVDSMNELMAATENALEAGALAVTNELLVE